MSSSDRSPAAPRRPALRALACRWRRLPRRLHGPAALRPDADRRGGHRPPSTSIAIDPVDTRVAQEVRNKLIFDLAGGSAVADPLYRMTPDRHRAPRSRSASRRRDRRRPIRSPSRRPTRSRALGTDEIVLRGTSRGTASYDRINQVFANIRAKLDAENRPPRPVADDIRIRLAAAAATGHDLRRQPGAMVEIKPADADRFLAAPDPASASS